MTRYLPNIGVVAALIVFNIATSFAAAITEENEALRTVSTTVNQFSTDFYKNVSKEEANNLICSPVSVSMVLSMAAFGAGGDTANEMRSGLRLPSDDSVSKSGFESLIDTLNNIKKVNLTLANKIFTASGFEVKPQFKEITGKYFKSEAQTLDFGNPEAASAVINAWCSAQTNNRIKNIIQPDALTQAAMVLVNAVYFKGNWKKKFDESLTHLKPFYINDKTSKDVLMMHKLDTFNYGLLPDLDAQFVELYYEHENENDSTSMFIILPNNVDGLQRAESNLDKVDFRQLHKAPHMTHMNLYLPKFKIESSLNLENTLTKMGMGRMFSNAADFTGITDSPPLKISKVIQKAFIEVNEEGSEAAAVTAGVVSIRSGHAILPPPITFTVDKPFVYAIVHGATNTILFQGHNNRPGF